MVSSSCVRFPDPSATQLPRRRAACTPSAHERRSNDRRRARLSPWNWEDRSLAAPPGGGVAEIEALGFGDAVGRQQPVAGAGAAVPRALEHADGRHGDPQRVAARAGRRRRAARRAGARRSPGASCSGSASGIPRRPRSTRARWPRCARSSTASTRRRSPCRGRARRGRAGAEDARRSRRSARSGRTPTSSRPSTRASRASSVGPDALVAPELAVVVETDDETARASAREYAALYLGLRNYTNNLLRFGFTERDVADGGSDRLIDAVIPHGSAEQIAEAVRAHLDAGADHVALQPLGHGAAPVADYEALAGALL